ncbi:hypothetical protein D1610_11700 [Sphingomonas gilva]|uniref:Tape measure protein N-terminal domain-containing protein n=1 Tax=Sphingomonas gilva TaxID=2305907 RepID=A0A396RN91_9SPHN|nr:tape measure protein [Sphingomonas gilva]RHW17206.1 hypothetical protein D1610_11700 [Sphingomonas gilva]
MKLSLILQAVDRWSKPVRKMKGDARDLARNGLDAAAKSATRLDRAIDRMVLGGSGRLDRLARSIRRTAGPLGMKALERSAYGAGHAIGWTTRKLGGLLASTAKWAAVGASTAAGAASGFFLSGIIGKGADFEQYQVQLEGLLGTEKKARAAMNWVRKFARDTPYEVDQVTAAFVRAKGLGIDAMSGSLRKMGDAASGSNKELMSAVEAVGDAMQFEFERLKEFNITTAVAGDRVTFKYLKRDGTSAARAIRKDMAEVRDAVLEIFDEKYGGGMIRQSRTLKGIWANITDMIGGFQLDTADAGFLSVVKGELKSILDSLNAAEKDGRLARWAKSLSDYLTDITRKAAKFVRETDWGRVASDIGSIVSALARVVEWIGKAEAAKRRFDRFEATAQAHSPFPWVRSSGRERLRRLDEADAIAAGRPLPGGRIVPGRAPIRPGARPLDRTWPRVPPATNWPRSVQPENWPRPVKTSNRVDVGGRIDIHLKGDGARGARVTQLSANDRRVPITASLGRAMDGDA